MYSNWANMKNISTESTYFEEVLLEPHSLAAFVVGEKEEKIGGLGIVKGDQQKYSRSEEVSCESTDYSIYNIYCMYSMGSKRIKV